MLLDNELITTSSSSRDGDASSITSPSRHGDSSIVTTVSDVPVNDLSDKAGVSSSGHSGDSGNVDGDSAGSSGLTPLNVGILGSDSSRQLVEPDSLEAEAASAHDADESADATSDNVETSSRNGLGERDVEMVTAHTHVDPSTDDDVFRGPGEFDTTILITAPGEMPSTIDRSHADAAPLDHAVDGNITVEASASGNAANIGTVLNDTPRPSSLLMSPRSPPRLNRGPSRMMRRASVRVPSTLDEKSELSGIHTLSGSGDGFMSEVVQMHERIRALMSAKKVDGSAKEDLLTLIDELTSLHTTQHTLHSSSHNLDTSSNRPRLNSTPNFVFRPIAPRTILSTPARQLPLPLVGAQTAPPVAARRKGDMRYYMLMCNIFIFCL